MQSGISVSDSLHSAFKSFLSTPNQRFLLASIENEAIVHKDNILSIESDDNSGTPDTSANVEALKAKLSPTQPLYILIRHPSTKATTTAATATSDASSTASPSSPNRNNTDDATVTALTYIPASAPVRPKTIFASTRLTLVRELGSGRFRGSELVDSLEEALEFVDGVLGNDGGGRGGGAEDGVGAGAGPSGKDDIGSRRRQVMSESERQLEDIKLEEAQQSRGLGARKAHVGSSGLMMPVDDEALEALKGLKDEGAGSGEEGGRLVQLAINVSAERIHFVSQTTCTPSDIGSAISATDPRFSFYHYSYTTPATDADAQESKTAILFIYTCPSSSKIKERMVYATSCQQVIQYAEREAGLKIAKRLEASEPSEITADTIVQEFAPKVEEKTMFAKPKRPGRR